VEPELTIDPEGSLALDPVFKEADEAPTETDEALAPDDADESHGVTVVVTSGAGVGAGVAGSVAGSVVSAAAAAFANASASSSFIMAAHKNDALLGGVAV